MKLILGAASVLALALFVLPVSAEDAPAVDPAPAAQQEVAPAEIGRASCRERV